MNVRFALAPMLCVAVGLLSCATSVAAQIAPGANPTQDEQMQALSRRLRDLRHQGRLREVLSQMGQYPEAVQRDDHVLGEWIQALLDLGKVDEARDLAASLPDDTVRVAPPLAVALVRLQYARGRVPEARQTADAMAEQIPRNPDLRALRALLDISEGDYAKAEAAMPSFSGNVAPQVASDVECALALAKAAELMSDDALLGRAVPLLEKALDKSPRRADVRALLARALVRWQRFEQASDLIDEGLAQDGLDDAGRAELECARGFLARGRRDGDAAVAAYEKVLELVPDQPQALLGLARCKSDAADYDAARELLDKCLSRDAHDLDALLALADVEGDAGRPDEAEAALRRVLEVKPNHLRALWQLSRLLARRGASDEVDALLKRYEERKKALDR
ncbi:MAG: tetratricopeptide repeat protein [Planctomycetes bacterium]|nr:tetratricopeptide repeat protein [Planctomycetota bacterium]